jgi:hypothetical protein
MEYGVWSIGECLPWVGLSDLAQPWLTEAVSPTSETPKLSLPLSLPLPLTLSFHLCTFAPLHCIFHPTPTPNP